MAIRDDMKRVRERWPEACEVHDPWRGRWAVWTSHQGSHIAGGPTRAYAWRHAAHYASTTYTSP